MEHHALTEQIIACAFAVHKKMGFGFLESVYENCLLIELRQAGLTAESQVPIDVLYEEHRVGHFVADILVENTVVIELKSVRSIVSAHEVQLVNYLIASGLPVGLLLNFAESRVEIKRKVRALSPPPD